MDVVTVLILLAISAISFCIIGIVSRLFMDKIGYDISMNATINAITKVYSSPDDFDAEAAESGGQINRDSRVFLALLIHTMTLLIVFVVMSFFDSEQMRTVAPILYSIAIGVFLAIYPAVAAELRQTQVLFVQFRTCDEHTMRFLEMNEKTKGIFERKPTEIKANMKEIEGYFKTGETIIILKMPTGNDMFERIWQQNS